MTKIITLANLATSTTQEVFDHVVAHARKQQAKATREESYVCLYRNEKGLACFAGCLMTDEEYVHIEKEDYFNNSSAWGSLIFKELVPSTHHTMIIGLQSIHDTFPVDRWEKQFSLMASDRHLVYTSN